MISNLWYYPDDLVNTVDSVNTIRKMEWSVISIISMIDSLKLKPNCASDSSPLRNES